MAAKKTPTTPGITSAEEQARANSTAPRQGAPITAAVPAVQSAPIEMRPAPPRAAISYDGFPRLKRIVFREKLYFTHSMFATGEVNLENADAAKVWGMRFATYFGRLSVELTRTVPTKIHPRIFRMPFEAIVFFETWEDNPHSESESISVNENAKPVANS